MHSNLRFLIGRSDRVADKRRGRWMDMELELEFECRLTFIGIEESCLCLAKGDTVFGVVDTTRKSTWKSGGVRPKDLDAIATGIRRSVR
jgi:hypothetical protein